MICINIWSIDCGGRETKNGHQCKPIELLWIKGNLNTKNFIITTQWQHKMPCVRLEKLSHMSFTNRIVNCSLESYSTQIKFKPIVKIIFCLPAWGKESEYWKLDLIACFNMNFSYEIPLVSQLLPVKPLGVLGLCDALLEHTLPFARPEVKSRRGLSSNWDQSLLASFKKLFFKNPSHGEAIRCSMWKS